MPDSNAISNSPTVLAPAALRRLSWAFGITQIISWGSLFYAVSVLGKSIRADLGLSENLLFGVVSMALLINGFSAPWVGRHIDAHGGRKVMTIGSLLAALAFMLLAFAQGPISYAAAWALGGIAMPMVLYEPAFATLTRHAGGAYRRALTTVTLFGGLASTVFWPLTSMLLDGIGWRGAFAVFAALQLCVCLPLHRGLIPPPEPAPIAPPAGADLPEARPAAASTAWRDARPQDQRAFFWLTVAFSFNAFNMAALLIHLLFLLQARGLSLEQAVLIGAIIGPAQVVARFSDVVFGARIKPLALGMTAMVLVFIGVLVLALSGGSLWVGIAFAVLFGMGNGLQTIARGVIVAEIFGQSAYGTWLGRMSRYVFIVHAAAPFVLSALIVAGVGYAQAAWVLVAVTVLAVLSFRIAVRPG